MAAGGETVGPVLVVVVSMFSCQYITIFPPFFFDIFPGGWPKRAMQVVLGASWLMYLAQDFLGPLHRVHFSFNHFNDGWM